MSRVQSSSINIIKPENFSSFELSQDVFYTGLFDNAYKIKDLVKVKNVIGQSISISNSESIKRHSFKRRLETLFSLKHEYLSQYQGISKQSPYLLITEYFSGGKLLYNVLKEPQENREKIFSMTVVNIIALCVAKAMSYLHENDVIHGNLSPRSIILTKEKDIFIPHVIDYGLIEFAANTPDRCVLAPEFKKKIDEKTNQAIVMEKGYSKESDVFSFGVLLGELTRKKNWCKKVNQFKASSQLKGTFSELINRCVETNPANRPTFDEIYRKLADHTYEFDETNRKKIDQIVKLISENDEKRATKEFKVLMNLKNPRYIHELKECAAKVTENTALSFFNIIGNHFLEKTDDKKFNNFLTVSLKLIQNPKICESFVKAELHKNLPFDKPNLAKKVFTIVYWLIEYQPNAIHDIANVIVFYMQDSRYAHRGIILLDKFVRKFHQIENPWAFVDLTLLALQQRKLVVRQDALVTIYYYLCKYHLIYQKARLSICVKVMSDLINSEENAVIRAVYAFFSEFRKEEIPNSSNFYKQTAKHLVNPHTAEAAVTFLLIKDSFEISKPLINSLIRLATKSRKANLLLCKISETEKGSQLLMKESNFIEAPLPDFESTFKILLILLRRPENVEVYRQSESLPYLLANLCKNANDDMLRCIQNLILFLDCDRKFINELEENNFCEEFYNSVVLTKYDDSMKITLEIFKMFALKNQTLDFYPELLQRTKEQLEVNKNFEKEILELFTILSTINTCIDQFVDYPIHKIFKKLAMKNEKYKEHIRIIQQNVAAYKSKHALNPLASKSD
ncbi:hypothetical protein TRFO_05638 [Tritrichomonas foetus]|uniref:Protein kinase domain-containing protein n=1 Tax=Tritrichomonas foetus TaxID=1144522 RepID=A0A1J4K4Q1_9EUKA|nr:hypothetical protein TRFO_05638 [Tritrichomonas foetus]|eukprot:OHT06425.1 hypothetical protein TRFO_05638 [Tritrichomonas foetus]